jgi:hypothetical protein
LSGGGYIETSCEQAVCREEPATPKIRNNINTIQDGALKGKIK